MNGQIKVVEWVEAGFFKHFDGAVSVQALVQIGTKQVPIRFEADKDGVINFYFHTEEGRKLNEAYEMISGEKIDLTTLWDLPAINEMATRLDEQEEKKRAERLAAEAAEEEKAMKVLDETVAKIVVPIIAEQDPKVLVTVSNSHSIRLTKTGVTFNVSQYNGMWEVSNTHSYVYGRSRNNRDGRRAKSLSNKDLWLMALRHLNRQVEEKSKQTLGEQLKAAVGAMAEQLVAAGWTANYERTELSRTVDSVDETIRTTRTLYLTMVDGQPVVSKDVTTISVTPTTPIALDANNLK